MVADKPLIDILTYFGDIMRCSFASEAESHCLVKLETFQKY